MVKKFPYDFKNSLAFTAWIYLKKHCSYFPCIQTNDENYKTISSILFSVQYKQDNKINSIS